MPIYSLHRVGSGFGWAATALRLGIRTRDWQRDRWQQVSVLAHAVAGAFYVHDDCVVQETVQQGGRDDEVAEHLAPLGKAAIGGQDHGAALVASIGP